MKKINLFMALAISALLLILATPVLAAPPTDNPGKGPPELDKIVFVHYGKEFAPGKPPGAPGKVPGDNTLYSYSGYHWANSNVSYEINPSGNPITDGTDATTGITTAFLTWQNDPNSNINFTCLDTSSSISPGINATSPDYHNAVGWTDLSASYPDAIAVAVVWATRGTKHIVDCDTALNNNSQFAWTQSDVTLSNANTTLLNNTSAYDVDVQNIMTHESGHWLMLNDLYTSAAIEQTMYGYASDRELKKRSLESGDLAGVRKIYP